MFYIVFPMLQTESHSYDCTLDLDDLLDLDTESERRIFIMVST